jgi:predicted Zn finger-like uncharacterized protein
MRLVCTNCDAKYDVPDEAIPEGGRDVQCANCGHAWFQMRTPLTSADATAEKAPDVKPEMAESTSAASAAATKAPQPKVLTSDDSADDQEPSDPPAGAAALPAHNVDDSVLAILREEAEREAEARLSDTRPVEPGAAAAALTAAQKRGATADTGKAAARRGPFPDVEAINSTLRPSEQSEDLSATDGGLEQAVSRRSGFRSGFLLMVTVSALGALVYMMAPQLSSQVPSLTKPLLAYTGFVDVLRLQLDSLMQAATIAIKGETS